MNNNGLADSLRVLNCPFDRKRVVAVNRPEIRDSQLLKEHAGDKERLEDILGLADFVHSARILSVHSGINAVTQIQIRVRCADFVQILVHTSDIFRNRTVIVIQHDYEIGIESGSVVQRFVSESAGQRAVSYDRNDRPLFTQRISRADKSETCGDGR